MTCIAIIEPAARFWGVVLALLAFVVLFAGMRLMVAYDKRIGWRRR